MTWQDHYNRNLVSPDEAVRLVSSGDRVYIPIYPHPDSLIHALAARRDELRDILITCDAPIEDPGWFDPSWSDSFAVTIEQILGEMGRSALDRRIVDYIPMIFSTQFQRYSTDFGDVPPMDVFMVVTSPPDANGYCSFGGHLWNKRGFVRRSKKVIAQVDSSQIRTYGHNYVHVSEIDKFVEYTPVQLSDAQAAVLLASVEDKEVRALLDEFVPNMDPRDRSEHLPHLVSRDVKQIQRFAAYQCWIEPPEDAKTIAGYVSELVKDGATLQIGTGTPSRYLATVGAFDDKKDLGWHSEMGIPGVIDLIRRGVITGARKTLHKDKAIFGALLGATYKEMDYAHENPLIEQLDVDYVAKATTAARNDNMVSINNALSVDLTGQINAETVFGGRLMSGTGGQFDFQMGAVMSKGGRGITLLRSTALGGIASRIVPQHEEGTIVSVPRTFADTIITEYGVAQLLGKSNRERARELINIAHPNFRADLTKAAQKLFYP